MMKSLSTVSIISLLLSTSASATAESKKMECMALDTLTTNWGFQFDPNGKVVSLVSNEYLAKPYRQTVVQRRKMSDDLVKSLTSPRGGLFPIELNFFIDRAEGEPRQKVQLRIAVDPSQTSSGFPQEVIGFIRTSDDPISANARLAPVWCWFPAP